MSSGFDRPAGGAGGGESRGADAKGGDSAASRSIESRVAETTHKSTTILRAKCVIVGDAAVGKTALTQMFFSGGTAYPKNYVMTVGVDFCMKTVNIADTATQVEMYMFDTSGQSIFNQREYGARHWEGASCVMVVYDVSNRESFKSCAKWLKGVRETRPGRVIPGVLVANKNDLRDSGRAVVEPEEGKAFAKEMGLHFFETSAQNNKDVDAAFHHLAKQFHRKYEETLTRVETMAI